MKRQTILLVYIVRFSAKISNHMRVRDFGSCHRYKLSLNLHFINAYEKTSRVILFLFKVFELNDSELFVSVTN